MLREREDEKDIENGVIIIIIIIIIQGNSSKVEISFSFLLSS